jgi:hypothetical protein
MTASKPGRPATSALARRVRRSGERGHDRFVPGAVHEFPPSQTPWREIQRMGVGQLDAGAALEDALKYQRLAQTVGVLQYNH